MAVNLSMRQFRQNDVKRMVATALEKSGLPASLLDLELTESVIMKDAAQTIETLRELKSLDVNLSIDDFGTGYSSLSYLKDLPLNALKLDLSFVNSLPGGNNEAISKTIIALAHNLGLRVIAEGVETSAQLKCLRGLGCDEVQGYLFSMPMPAGELTAFLADYACDTVRSEP
jgi:EAL domain-containing protein (putative c-di-GMP-specific phosphodiesterase class I)